MNDKRPTPEAWLKQATEEAQKEQRGKLKIYLGAAPGVGKTYAMLQDAIAKHGQGLEVVVGIAESHGRQEIEALLKKLEILPREKIYYRDCLLLEFDLKAAIKRNPDLILIDEMAHTNAPGMNHKKRWQDIEAILEQGIDVYTTLNIQHIESLNNVVSRIIQIHVRETIPDTALELADAIELIDLPPEDLLKRLQEGKVYVPRQAEYAKTHFFRMGNLISLRELALRVTAERVEAQVILHRQHEGIRRIWPTSEKILVCIGPEADTLNLIRTAKRMATNLHAHWIAVYVDTGISEERRNKALQNLNFAEKLGAQTRVLSGINIVDEIMTFAREQNVTQIMIWKKIQSRIRDFISRSLADKLVHHSGEIDVHIVTPSLTDQIESIEKSTSKRTFNWKIYGASIGIVTLTTLINLLIYPFFESGGNLIMVYMLSVILVAWFGHEGASILASLSSVLAYDFFFLLPKYSLAVGKKDFITLVMMLLITLILSHFTVLLRRQTKTARLTEHYTATLYALSRQLASSRGENRLLQTAVRYIGELLNSKIWILLSKKKELIVQATYKTKRHLTVKEKGIAQWVFERGQKAGLGTDTISSSDLLYFPLMTNRSVLGVLIVCPIQPNYLFNPEQIHLLEACANQVAVTLEVDQLDKLA